MTQISEANQQQLTTLTLFLNEHATEARNILIALYGRDRITWENYEEMCMRNHYLSSSHLTIPSLLGVASTDTEATKKLVSALRDDLSLLDVVAKYLENLEVEENDGILKQLKNCKLPASLFPIPYNSCFFCSVYKAFLPNNEP